MKERYPESPGYVSGSDTSYAAAASVEDDASTMRARVLACIKENGPATCDEVEVLLDMAHQTCSARIRELCLKDQLIDTGGRAKTRSARSARIYDTPDRFLASSPPVMRDLFDGG